MICGFCGNQSTAGCIHCNPMGFGPGEIAEVPPETDIRQMKFHLSTEQSQLDRIEAKLDQLLALKNDRTIEQYDRAHEGRE